jgi:hypothetical protein
MMDTDTVHADVDDGLSLTDLLAYGDLLPADGRAPDSTSVDRPRIGVRCGRPLIYPVPAADLPTHLRRRAEITGGRYVGALFAFDLDPLPDRQRYTAARFEVTLADRLSLAVQLHGDGGALGLTYDGEGPEPASATAAHTVAAASARSGWLRRLASRPGTARAWSSGIQSHEFSWVYDDPRGELLVPRAYCTHALLELPAGATKVSGMLGVRVETADGRGRGGAGRHVAGLRESVAFAEPLTPADTVDGAAVRMCMAADVSGYSGRSNADSERIQADLVKLLSRVRRAGGIDDSAVTPQPQGDGQFTVLPVGIDESVVIPRMVQDLGRALGELNGSTAASDRLRLRVALHRGLVKAAPNGWVGSASIAVHRILDSPPLRATLRERPAADFVLGLPDVLYQDVIRHTAEPPLPAEFRPITIDLPAKNFVEHGWLHVGPEEDR